MSIHVQSADDPQEPTPAIAVGSAPSGSIVEKLRQQAAGQQKQRIKAFPVGGDFGNWLQIRYSPLAPELLDDFLANQTEVSQQRAIELNMDMMARACIGVIGVDQNTKEVTVLADEQGPIKLEHRLIVLLDMPYPDGAILTAREAISYIFGNNGLAIGEHGDQIASWMRNPGAAEGNS